MLRDIFRIFRASVGLVKDSTASAVKGYLDLLRRLAVPSLVALGISVLLAITALAFEFKPFNVVAVLVAGIVAAGWVVATLPILAIGSKVAEFEILRFPLRLLQYIAGAAFLLCLLAILVPADSMGLSRLTLLVVALAGSLIVFGLTRSLQALKIKMAGILVVVILAVLFPRSASVAPGLLIDLDNAIRNIFSRTVIELALTEEKLQKGPFWDRHDKPLYWCRPADDRDWGYRCYNRDGRDPSTNEKLVGINEVIVKDARRRMTALQAKRAAAQSPERPPLLMPRGPQPPPSDKLERREGLETSRQESLAVQPAVSISLRPFVATGAQSASVAIVIELDSRFDTDLMRRLRDRAQQSMQGRVTDGMFLETLVADGPFDQLMRGDKALVESLQPDPPADLLVLGSASVRHEASSLVQAPVADLTVEMRIINGRTGGVLAGREFKRRAIGHTAGEALQTARKEAADEIAKWVGAETAGR